MLRRTGTRFGSVTVRKPSASCAVTPSRSKAIGIAQAPLEGTGGDLHLVEPLDVDRLAAPSARR